MAGNDVDESVDVLSQSVGYLGSGFFASVETDVFTDVGCDGNYK